MPSRPSSAAQTAEAPELEDDPRIVEEVERALDPFRARLPPEALAAMREDMLAFATTHPAMKELWCRARPRVVPETSG